MVYCSKCGKKNEDDAEYCNQCGASLTPSKKEIEKEWEDRCERDCEGGGGKGSSFLWGAIVIIIGLWIIFEFVLKNIGALEGMPGWIQDFEFWWVVALIIGIAIISSGIRMVTRK